MGFANRKYRIKTRGLIPSNFNDTGVSNLYKFTTVLKSEIYTNNFFPPKKFLCQSIKKRSLPIANCLINLFQKLNKDQKNFILEIQKELKTIYGLHFPFAINFMFELKMLFRKKLDMTFGLI